MPVSEAHPDRRTFETKFLAQRVFQIPTIRKVYLFWIVREENECRWIHICLGDIVELQPFARSAWRLMPVNRFLEHTVQGTRADPLLAFLKDFE